MCRIDRRARVVVATIVLTYISACTVEPSQLAPTTCVTGAERPGETACGLNLRGTLREVCEGGSWGDSETCIDPDICTDETMREGLTPCGLNGAGILEQQCIEGGWKDSEACVDPDICTNDDTKAGTTPCGLNTRGLLDLHCVAGQWVDSETCVDPDICTDEASQAGTTPCGLNQAGSIDHVCVDGQWTDTETCVDPDVCINEATQAGTIPCGLNNNGLLDEVCVNGQWRQSEVCVDPDVCLEEATQPGNTPCGLNDNGLLEHWCVAGQWENSETCVDPDVCTNGALQPGVTACGLNGQGAFEQLCMEGQWVDTKTCVDPDICKNGQTQPGVTPCGWNGAGAFYQICTEGQWADSTTCVDTDACANGETKDGTSACGLNGKGYRDRVCTEGQWQDSETCSDPDICTNGAAQAGTTPCGPNGKGTLNHVCADGQWEDSEICVGADICQNGSIQPGTSPCGLNDGGLIDQLCVEGLWTESTTCTDPDICVNGQTQAGNTPCGLNENGLLDHLCEGGQWIDSEVCVDPDTCTHGDTQPGATPCGLNGEGTLDEVCDDGAWIDSELCSDPDLCANGETQAGDTPCGLNQAGALEQQCALGQWVDTESCIDPDLCENDASQAGSVPCGLNGAGVLDQVCVQGQWSDSGTCVDPDACTNGDTQAGSGACGLNGAGAFEEQCTDGQWTTSETCVDPDVCTNGALVAGDAPCGLNNQGALSQLCADGQWTNSETCIDPDVCTNDDVQSGTTLCGLNGAGALDQRCEGGQWADTESCIDPDVCENGATQSGSAPCGLNGAGLIEQLCSAGQWTDSATCLDPDQCTNGHTQPGSTPCGLNQEGALDQACTSGQWSDTGTCVDPDVCTNDEVQSGTTPCGLNGAGSLDQRCVAGQWSDAETCVDPDICQNGAVQEGSAPCGLNQEGTFEQVCEGGTWTDTLNCTGTDVCQNGDTQSGVTSCGLDNAGDLLELCAEGEWTDSGECAGAPVYGRLKAYGRDRWRIEVSEGEVVTIAAQPKENSSIGLGHGMLWETFVDVSLPSGEELTLDWLTASQGIAPTPFIFTASESGIYTIDAHGFKNDVGGYELSVYAGDKIQPVVRGDLTPLPSESPMLFYTPETPEEDWSHSASGDLSIEKPYETWVFSGLENQNLKIDVSMVAPYPNDRDDLTETALYLFDEAGQLVTWDDDSGPGESARIYHTLGTTGTYRIVATTYGHYNERNWGDISGTGWTLGPSGVGHYELSVVAKSTLDFVREDLTMANPNAVKINAILVTADETLTALPMDQPTLEAMITSLNQDFGSLYSLDHWPGFELASITRFYEPTYAFTAAPHEALGEIGNTPAALQNHVNLIILDIDNEATGIVGTTNLKGSILGPRGAALVLEFDAGSPVLIHEMSHVTGVQHLAGTWPPNQMTLTRADGSEFGYWTFDHSSPESSYMSTWDSFSYEATYYYLSWYLTKGQDTLNSPTHGRLCAEALRTWLVDNQIIDQGAPGSGYAGPSGGDGVATAFWTWDPAPLLLQADSAATHAIFPVSTSSASPANSAAATMWEQYSGTQVWLRYRDTNGQWKAPHQSAPTSGDSVGSKHIAMNAQGDAVALWSGWYSPGIDVVFHGHESTAWSEPLSLTPDIAPGGQSANPTLAINDAGEAYAAWVQRADPSAPYQVLLRERNPSDGVWADAVELHSGGLVAFPELAVNASGDLWVVWQEYLAGAFVVRGRFRDGASKTWTELETYSETPHHAGLPFPALNAAGNGVVLWRQADGAHETYSLATSAHLAARIRNKAGALGSLSTVSSPGEDAFHTAIETRKNNLIITADGRAAVAWSGFDGNDYRIYVAQMANTGEWASPIALSVAGQNGKLPSLALGEGGVLAATWQRSDGSNSRVQASVYEPNTQEWSIPVSLSEAGQSAFWSTLTSDGGGNFTAFWSRSDGSNFLLESRRATLTP